MKLFKLHPDGDARRIIYMAVALEECHVRDLADQQGIDMQGLTIERVTSLESLISNEQAEHAESPVNPGVFPLLSNPVIHSV